VRDGLFRIGELSRRTGLSPDVIRAWERRYALLRPARTSGNLRMYSIEDISRLRLMQHYLARNIPAGRAAELVHEAQTAAHDRNPGIPAGDVRRALVTLRDSLERYDDAPADRVLERLLALFPPGAVLRDVVLPYLRELGERWACAEATVAQEHFASSFLEAWMLGLARGWSRSGRRRTLLACIPGERHVLGLIAFGLAVRELGWRVTYLGADTPLGAVERAADALAPDAVVLAAALPGPLAEASDAIAALARRHPVAVGGAAAARGRAALTASRVLPADPLVAAQALTLREADRA
jgi:MerR family transcriptional regulator, light-induced transcriptional regulator